MDFGVRGVLGLVVLCAAVAAQDLSALGKRLKDADPAARKAAAGEIADLGAKAAKLAPDLAGVLADKDPAVAEAAGRALGKVGKPAIKWIRDPLRDRSSRIGALLAVEALGADGAELVPDILAALTKFEDKESSDAANKAVRAIGAPAVPFLQKGTKVRVCSPYAAEMLGELGALAAPAVPELMALAANRTELLYARGKAADAIGRIGKPARAQAPKLLAIALDPKEDNSVREHALNAIAWTGSDDPQVADGVTLLLSDKEPRIAASAKSVLQKLK
jgi:HEAT repeat protein